MGQIENIPLYRKAGARPFRDSQTSHHWRRLVHSPSVMRAKQYADVDVNSYAPFVSGHEIRGQSCVNRFEVCAEMSRMS